jgi:ABC-type hemin transport system ATPase subunit
MGTVLSGGQKQRVLLARALQTAQMLQLQGERLADIERSALERAIAPATLEHWGRMVEPNGRVKTDSGQVVYSAGYVGAIHKALGR